MGVVFSDRLMTRIGVSIPHHLHRWWDGRTTDSKTEGNDVGWWLGLFDWTYTFPLKLEGWPRGRVYGY